MPPPARGFQKPGLLFFLHWSCPIRFSQFIFQRFSSSIFFVCFSFLQWTMRRKEPCGRKSARTPSTTRQRRLSFTILGGITRWTNNDSACRFTNTATVSYIFWRNIRWSWSWERLAVEKRLKYPRYTIPIDWLIDWSTVTLIDQLVTRSMNWLIDWLMWSIYTCCGSPD